MPAHGPVSKCDHLVRNPCVDKRLGADNAPGAARTVDDDGGRRRGDNVADAQDQLRSRDIDTFRYRYSRVFVEWPTVEHLEVNAVLQHCVQLGSTDVRRAAVVFDELTKSFAWHVHAREQHKASLPPRRYTAIEKRKVCVA